MIDGYARVPTDGQSVDAQVCQYRAVGAGHVFRGTAREAKTDRVQVRRVLNTLAAIVDRKAGFRSRGDTSTDTTTTYGGLMPTVLGRMADFERELIRARMTEGRWRALARGVKLGRKLKSARRQQKEALRHIDAGETTREIARSYNAHNSTIPRLAG